MQLSEVYTSTQGEGPRVGLPTVFVRFAGCNLKCPGWPCDTQHAIDPKLYRDEWKVVGPREIADQIQEQQARYGVKNICFTGGEPFLQRNDDLRDLAEMLLRDGTSIEAFTNGTLRWPPWAVYHIKFVMDWKLQGSGDSSSFENMMVNASQLRAKDAVKFTVASEEDFREAVTIWEEYRKTLPGKPPKVYVGIVWGKAEPADLVRWILEARLPWRLNMQVHKFVWVPDARRT